VLIVALNVKFHLFQEPINQYTAVIVSDKTNHKIQEVIDIPEMIEVQDIPEMIEVQDLHLDENLVEIILDLASHEVINF
jgi:hypothetical protein